MAVFKKWGGFSLKKFFSRLTSSVLTAAFLFTQYPVIAQGIADLADSTTVKTEKFQAKPEILGEDISKREEFVKHFRMSDGSMKAVVYSDQIHYKNGDKFSEIDNTLIEENVEYKNTESPLKIRISKNFNDKKIASVKSDDHEISWNYIKKNRKVKLTKKIKKINKKLDKSDINVDESEQRTTKKENLETTKNGEIETLSEHPKVEILAENEVAEEFEEVEVSEALDLQPEAVQIENLKTKTRKFANKKDEKTDVSKAHSKAKFKNADPEVDLEYAISGLKFKENIILNKKIDFEGDNSFDFQFKTDLKIEKDNSENLNFKDQNGKTIFVMPKGSMWDSAEGFSNDVDYKFKKNENGYIISIIPDSAWINSPERQFPIFIDPSLIVPNSEVSHVFGIVDQSLPNQTFPNHNHMPIGNAYNWLYSAFIKYNKLPNFSHGEMITYAEFSVAIPSLFETGQAGYIGSSPMSAIACARPVTADWNASTLTYANKPPVSPVVCDYFTVETLDSWYNLNITKIAKEWYSLDNPTSNFGFELNTFDPDKSELLRIISKDNSFYQTEAPCLTISYRNFIGEEPYWSYTSHDAGLNGHGKVNNYAGTLSISENICATTGARNPVSITNTYNNSNYSNYANENVLLQKFLGGYKHSALTGHGFTVDFNQIIYKLTPADIERLANPLNLDYKYLLIDDDGTWHYFYFKDGKIIDEDGLCLVIEENFANNELILKDKYDNKLIFGKPFPSDICFSLKATQDNDGNKTTYHYDYQPNTPSSKVSRIEDASGRLTHVAYNANGMVAEITEPDNSITRLTYSGDKLSEITYPDGLKTGYIYDLQGRISRVWTNEGTGSSTQYQYLSNSVNSPNFFKIKSVTEFGSQNAVPGSAGNTVIFDYSMNQTKITYKTSNLDVPYHENTEIWQFDDEGRTTCVMDENGNMVAKYYETQGEKKNKVKHANDTGKYTSNLLRNTAAGDGMDYWGCGNWANSFPPKAQGWDVTASTSEKNLGEKSFKIEQNCGSFPIMNQRVYIPKLTAPKQYTLSADIKVDGALTGGGAGARLHLLAWDGNTIPEWNYYSESIYETDNDWRRISVTFTAPIGTDSIVCYASLNESNGTAYFDCFQLEEGEFANDYNAVENSDFRYDHADGTKGMYAWGNNNFALGSDKVIDGRVRILGDPTKKKNFFQTVKINKVNPVLAIRVSAQGNSVPNNLVKGNLMTCFYVSVKLEFDDNTSGWADTFFNPNVSDKQCIYSSICAKDYGKDKVLKSICVYPAFHANCNTAYFSEIQVCIDDSGVQYERNDKGSITESIGNIGNKTIFKRDLTSDEILEIEDSQGNKTNFAYGVAPNVHRLKNSIISTPSGRVKTTFDHDLFGNVKKTEVQATNNDGTVMSGKLIESESPYSLPGNYQEKFKDSHGNTTTFVHNEKNGNLNSITNANNVTTNYDYDATGRITSASCGDAKTNYTYTNGVLTKISNSVNVAYNFIRDAFGKIAQIKIGDQTLVKNVYDVGNGLLKLVKYNNNQQTNFDYDKLGRLVKKRHHSGKEKQNGGFQYAYDNKNRLIKTFDEENNLTTNFEYDMYGRIAYVRRSDGVSSDIKYNPLENLVDKVISKIFGVKITTENTFGASNAFLNSKITTNNNSIWHKNFYDSLGRIQSNETLNFGETSGLKHEFSYHDIAGTNKTTNTVDSIEVKKKSGSNWLSMGKKFSYKYDDLGNIKEIYENNGQDPKVQYFYDQYNQLIRENNKYLGTNGQTVVYEYDLTGNILEKKIYTYVSENNEVDLTDSLLENSIVYGYSGSDWKDQMTSYNNQEIIYDGIGNPTKYRDDWKFEWVRGRRLDKASKTGYDINYKYDDSGIRTQKTVNGVTTNFVTSGMQILAQKIGNDVLAWQIAGNGSTTGFDYNGTQYYYLKNAQGDIVAIADAAGNIVANYTYDSWGKLISIKDGNGVDISSNAAHIANINPLRYRGYYYDFEIGLYYLNSRYYDPETGRFISADDNLSDLNLYRYCGNNSINFYDPDGEDAILLIDKNAAWKAGHMGIAIEKDGKWYHFYYGCGDNAVLSVVGQGGTRAELWEFEFGSSSKDHNGINSISITKEKMEFVNGKLENVKEKLYDGTYTDSRYLYGDFSASYDHIVNNVTLGKTTYNATSYNCKHASLDALSMGTFSSNNTEYQKLIKKAYKKIKPNDAFKVFS